MYTIYILQTNSAGSLKGEGKTCLETNLESIPVVALHYLAHCVLKTNILAFGYISFSSMEAHSAHLINKMIVRLLQPPLAVRSHGGQRERERGNAEVEKQPNQTSYLKRPQRKYHSNKENTADRKSVV